MAKVTRSARDGALAARIPVAPDATLHRVADDPQREREEWKRRRRITLLNVVGLALLSLGVLVLAYVALTYSPSQ